MPWNPPPERTKTHQQFKNAIQGVLDNGSPAHYHILTGAGFSVSAGIPLASEIAGILARIKNERGGARGSSSPATLIRQFLAGELKPQEELVRLQQAAEYASKSNSELYQQLFLDDEILPGKRVGRRMFIAELISQASQQNDGYNFESLYLAFLADRSRQRGLPFLTTILTTNFDDVLPNSFFFLGAPYRTLDADSLLAEEKGTTEYPRIAYLHGRYLHYNLANTAREIKNRKDHISRFLHSLPTQSGLIVVGYKGWEDMVMASIREILEGDGLAAGIYWCHRKPTVEDLSDPLREMMQAHDNIDVVPGTSARDAMRILLEAAGTSETEVIQTLRTNVALRLGNFDQRVGLLGEADLGFGKATPREYPSLPPAEAPSPKQALDAAAQALHKARTCTLALAMIEAALRPGGGRQEQMAELYRARGDLRLRYRRELSAAKIDYQMALKLGKANAVEVMLGLAEVYLLLQEEERAREALQRVRQKSPTDKLTAAKCDALAGRMAYLNNEFAPARQLMLGALDVFTAAGEVDWAIKVSLNLVFLDEYTRCFEPARTRISQIRTALTSRPASTYWSAPVGLAEAKLCLREDDLKGARKALSRARLAAEEGPSFEFLGLIASLEADLAARSGDLERAQESAREAILLAGLAGQPRRQLLARLTLHGYRSVVDRDFAPDWREAALKDYRQLEEQAGDPVEAAVYWSLLAFCCCANGSYRSGEPLIRAAMEGSERCFERLLGQSPRPPDRDLSLIGQYVHLARLVGELTLDQNVRGAAPAYEALRKAISEVGFESGEIEVLQAAAALRLLRQKLLGFDQLIPSPAWGSGSQVTRRRFQAFCKRKGYPYYLSLLAEP